MLTFEYLAVAFFAAFAAAAPLARRGGRTTAHAVLLCAAGVALTVAAARTLSLDARLWLGHVYLVLAYWTPGVLSRGARTGAFERWLAGTDPAWQRRARRLPRWLASAAAFAYLLCIPAVPAGFVLILVLGGTAAAGGFWTAVLGAGFACYGPLPWLLSRPPAAADTPASRGSVHTLNRTVLRRFSHGWNTFPSGHVAVSTAVTSEVAAAWPAAGAAFGLLAIGVAIGAVTGRHHYAADVLAGAGVALAILLLT